MNDINERRARAMFKAESPTLCHPAHWNECKDTYLMLAKAVRESDEAAGLVVVPYELNNTMRAAAVNTTMPMAGEPPLYVKVWRFWGLRIKYLPRRHSRRGQ